MAKEAPVATTAIRSRSFCGRDLSFLTKLSILTLNVAQSLEQKLFQILCCIPYKFSASIMTTSNFLSSRSFFLRISFAIFSLGQVPISLQKTFSSSP